MWILYSTVGCHLCDQALSLFDQVVDHNSGIEIKDIAGDSELVEKYGIRIPVIKNLNTGSELGWPFTEEELKLWVEQQKER